MISLCLPGVSGKTGTLGSLRRCSWRGPERSSGSCSLLSRSHNAPATSSAPERKVDRRQNRGARAAKPANSREEELSRSAGTGARFYSPIYIAALGPRYRRVSYASGVFFTLAMHLRLLTNFLFRHFDLPLRPPLHRLPPQMPHLLDDPLFGRVRLLEISLRVLYGADDRRESISKIRVLLEKCQKLLRSEERRRHLLSLHRFVESTAYCASL